MNATNLIDLLGRRWALGSAVTAIALDATETTAAFALADGRLALAPVADPDSAVDRYHVAGDTGRATITPRRSGTAPIIVVAGEAGHRHVAAFGATGFLAGGITGALDIVAPDGNTTRLASVEQPLRALAQMNDGSVLVALGQALMTAAPGDASIHPLLQSDRASAPVAAAPGGDWLAHGGVGLTLRHVTDPRRGVEVLTALDPQRLTWSPDGRWLAASLTGGGVALLRFENGRVLRTIGLPNYPALVRALSWDSTSRLLATSGAYRIIVWPVEQFETEVTEPRSLPTGRSGLATVESIAVHPQRALIAAAYENGMVVVAPIGERDELVVRTPGGDPVTEMTWSRDGQSLVFGTEAGEASIITFPPQLFK
ncbi:WD40 repeat domain-containing protein [Methylobacterium brachiatum]|uniref:WD40 repeat domain-containing protein n=1 Tax=Methylobacterium brachiatum TaxID=269660 RepID=UPI000EFBB444|nr:WD40 repeat domain-containing protein [Methylobacterium brachiatum]AYO81055.1 WD40 repeat domain-containing protein [Methylobacterium brachiatum]